MKKFKIGDVVWFYAHDVQRWTYHVYNRKVRGVIKHICESHNSKAVVSTQYGNSVVVEMRYLFEKRKDIIKYEETITDIRVGDLVMGCNSYFGDAADDEFGPALKVTIRFVTIRNSSGKLRKFPIKRCIVLHREISEDSQTQ